MTVIPGDGPAVGVDEATIQEIVRRVLSVAPARKIILFGSAATGTMTPDSDIDLLVLLDPPYDPWAEMRRIRRSLIAIDFPFDVLVMEAGQFDERKGVIGGIAYPANKYGRVIHDAA